MPEKVKRMGGLYIPSCVEKFLTDPLVMEYYAEVWRKAIKERRKDASATTS